MKTMLLYIKMLLTRNLSFIFISVFMVLICLMLSLFTLENIIGFKIKRVDLGENRTFAALPNFSQTPANLLPKKIEDYFNDNLPLRTQIIYKYRKIWKDCLPKESAPIPGKSGHYFKSIDLYKKHTKDISLQILYRLRTYIVGKNYFWKLNNCKYYVFLATDKIKIYPEFLPDWAQGIKDQNQQIINFIYAKTGKEINIYDLEPLILKNKGSKLLYNKTQDLSHWNGNSLAIVYDYLCNILNNNPNFSRVSKGEAFHIENRETKKSLFSVDDTMPWMVLNEDGLEKYAPNYIDYPKRIWDGCDVIINNKVDKGTIFLATDSYLKATHQNLFHKSNGVIFPLVHNFHTYIHSHYKLNSTKFLEGIVEKYNPNIAIEEFVVRGGPDYGLLTTTNREFFIAGTLILKESSIFITPEDIQKNATNVSNIISNPVNNSYIEINITENSNPIKLNNIMPNSDGRIVVMSKIDAPVDSKIVVFYKQSNNKYKSPNEIHQKLIKGVNYVYIPIYGIPDKEFRLSFSFSAKNANYKIFSQPNIDTLFIER